jgi:WD40 repeat protein/class 3 adenylate cyclase
MPNLPSGSVTLLFTDIEGSTRLLTELGGRYADVLTWHRRLLREAFEQHRGREVDTQGDSFFVVFSDPGDAVDAAAAGQKALATHPWPEGVAVRVRMGIHTGEPLVVGEHYVGIDVHRAARIAAAAHGGQVLVSKRTRELVADGAASIGSLRELGAHRLKDLPGQERLFQLVIPGLPSSFRPPRVHKEAPASAGLPDYSLPPADVQCPYKGLAPFEPEDSDFFFGREELVEVLVSRLEEAGVLAVVGPSGSGKSSLLRAGLVPELERRRFAAGRALLTPGEHPLSGLALALSGVLERPADALIKRLSSDPGALGAELRAARDTSLVLAVDQFEEVFTLCRDEDERRLFIDALLRVSEVDGSTIQVIIALRADFYGHCVLYPRLASALEDHQALVGSMTEEELRRAIERPAEQAGLMLEPGLVEGILRDVVGEPGALPLLSHSLLETWKQRSGRMLTLIGYLQAGGVRGAIAKTAETVYRERLTPKQQTIARNSFLRLTELGKGTEETRRRVRVSELIPRAEEAEEVEEVLGMLVDARLLTMGEGTVEVAHEALIRNWPTLRTWLDEDREGKLVHRRLTEAAQEWGALGQDRGALYRGTRLSVASEWAELHDSQLNELERDFLSASREAEISEIGSARRRNRRLRVLVAALAFLLIGTVIAGALALLQRQEARSAATSAVAQRLGAQALVQKDLDLSLLLAKEGVDLDDSIVTQGNLLAALVRSPAAIGVLRPLPIGLVSVVTGPDGRFVAAEGWTTVAVIDARTMRKVRTFAGNDPFYGPDGRTIVLREQLSNGERIVIRDVASGTVRNAFRVPAALQGSSFVVSRDLKRSAAWTRDGTGVVIRDLASGRIVARIRSRARFSNLYMPDRRHLLTIGYTGTRATYDLWDLAKQQLIGSATVRSLGFEPYALSRDASRLAVGADDGSVTVYDLGSGKGVPLRGRHAASVTDVAFGPGGKLVTTGDDRQILVWNLASRAVVETLTGHNASVTGAAFSPDGGTVYTAGADGTLMSWDLGGSRRLGRPFVAGAGHAASEGKPGTLVALSATGSRMAVPELGGRVVVRDVESLAKIKRVLVPDVTQLVSAALSPAGTTLATGGADGEVALWDVRTGARLGRNLAGVVARVHSVPNRVHALAFSPNGRTLAAGDNSHRLHLWDVRSKALSGRPLDVPHDPLLHDPKNPNADAVRGLVFRRDGSLLAAAHGSDVSVWALPKRKLLYTVDVDGNAGEAVAVAFSPDGSLLATGGGTGEVRFWRAETGIRTGRSITAAGSILSLGFDPTGQIVVSSGTDGATRLLDVPSRVLVGPPLPGLDGEPSAAELTPDGRRVIVVYESGTGFRWEVSPSMWKRHACAVAGRNLTRAEWDQFLDDRDYRTVCAGA